MIKSYDFTIVRKAMSLCKKLVIAPKFDIFSFSLFYIDFGLKSFFMN